MAVTKGEMTSLPTSQTIFLQSVEDPEENRINFRDSLKFFQEQLVINGANFPSPSPVCRSGNNTLKKNRHRANKEQTPDSNGKISKDSNTFESDLQSIKSCKIAIPTVDTILESVRVLRAIQKSQEERGSNWKLDVTSKSDINFKGAGDWIQVTDVKQNGYSEKESKHERNGKIPSNSFLEKQIIADVNLTDSTDQISNNEKSDNTPSLNSVEKQAETDINQNGYSDKNFSNEKSEVNLTSSVDKQTIVDINETGCSHEEINNEKNEIQNTNSVANQTVTDINQSGCSHEEKNNEKNEVQNTNPVADQTVTGVNQNGCSDRDMIVKSEINLSNSVNKLTVVDIHQNGCSDKEINNEKHDETYSANFGGKQVEIDLNLNGYSVNEPNKQTNYEAPSANSIESDLITGKNGNKNSDKESNDEETGETFLTNSLDKQTIPDINQNGCFNKEYNNESSFEILSCDSVDKQSTNTITEPKVNGTENNFTQSSNESQSDVLVSNSVNEICSFWPVNTLNNENHWNEEKKSDSTVSIAEENKIVISENLNEINAHKHVDKTDTFSLNENIFEVESKDKQNLTEDIKQRDVCNNNILRNINKLEHSNDFQSPHEDITKNTKLYDAPDSLHAVCTDFLSHLNEKASHATENSKEMLLKGSENEVLKIETYEDIDAQKHEHFLLNESIWKENCSPSDSSFTKIEHNDSDSGIGTQRSASSLSPNNPSQMQKDSWSDTCSSHYASAECSPYHSLNSVFESSMGLNSTPGETKEIEHSDILTRLTESEWEVRAEKAEKIPRESIEEDPTLVPQENKTELTDDQTPVPQDYIKQSSEDGSTSVPQQPDCDREKDRVSDKYIPIDDFESHSENAELDAEISYCNFIPNYTIEKPYERIEEKLEEAQTAPEACDNIAEEPKILNDQETNSHEHTISEQTFDVGKADSLISHDSIEKDEVEDDSCDLYRIEKFSAASCDLISVVESLYTTKENPAYQVLPTGDTPEEKFEETLFVLSKGAFCEHPEDNYFVIIEDSILHITKDSHVLLSLNMKYGEVTIEMNILKIDNRMGRCVYIRCEFDDALPLQDRIKLHCLKHWQTDCLQLVHYPLKYHQNIVIIDIGSCSTRAGILMDQPTLPSLFFPTICATNKQTGTCVYGMEALQPEVRQHSNLSFPVRPTIKITKHTIDIDLMEGLFKKIFHDLNVDPTQYTIQVSLPRNLSINAQTALVKLLLEGLKVKAVSLTNQALLTLYAHDISTAVVVDIGDRTDVLPVVDGFIVENGVTKLPHGGQRLIHHMKHGLAEKRLSLSNDIDSFIVQYIIENLAYIAEDYEKEIEISSHYPDIVTKTVVFKPVSSNSVHCKSITLEEARFKIPEGLFNPELWGLDSPGIHHLVQKAIQATSVDARKRIAENIYVSGGVTMLPGFVERLHKEVTKLSKAKIVPKVYASNYRYHCTYIGACKFAKMEVFPQVCITLQEYTKNSTSALKKCALYF